MPCLCENPKKRGQKEKVCKLTIYRIKVTISQIKFENLSASADGSIVDSTSEPQPVVMSEPGTTITLQRKIIYGLRKKRKNKLKVH